MERFDIRRISSPRLRDHIDWTALDAVRSDNDEVRRLFSWLGECTENEQAVGFDGPR